MKFIIYSSLLLLFACDTSQVKKHSQSKQQNDRLKLQVAVNANFYKYLDYPATTNDRFGSIEYDSVSNHTTFTFDTLQNSKVKINIFSLLTNDFEKEFRLLTDTTIYFDTTQYAGFKLGDPKTFLSLKEADADTLFIGQKMRGCFAGSTEKIIITRLTNVRQIIYRENYNTAADYSINIPDSAFSKSFRKFIINTQKRFQASSDGWSGLNSSTTRYSTFIRKGAIIYEIPDFNDWEDYDNFKRAIGIAE
jgi:hypothetical protein